MAVTFPSSPSNGDTFNSSGRKFVYNSSLGVWESPNEYTGVSVSNTDVLIQTLTVNATSEVLSAIKGDGSNIDVDLSPALGKYLEVANVTSTPANTSISNVAFTSANSNLKLLTQDSREFSIDLSDLAGSGASGGFSNVQTITSNGAQISVWGTIAVIDTASYNSISEVILPASTSADEGKEIAVIFTGVASSYPVKVSAKNAGDSVNGVSGEGGFRAGTKFSAATSGYSAGRVFSSSANNYLITDGGSTSAESIYQLKFNTTGSSTFTAYLDATSAPSYFMTNDNDWWFAVRHYGDVTSSLTNGRPYFFTNGYGIGFRPNGTYWMTHTTSGYLMAANETDPTLSFTGDGGWVVFTYDSSANKFNAWVDGVKSLTNQTPATSVPSADPTALAFGDETTSGYFYEWGEDGEGFTSIMVGNTLPSDSEVTSLTNSMFKYSQIPSAVQAKVTHAWSFDAGDTINNDKGSITLSINESGDEISTAEI